MITNLTTVWPEPVPTLRVDEVVPALRRFVRVEQQEEVL